MRSCIGVEGKGVIMGFAFRVPRGVQTRVAAVLNLGNPEA